MGRGKGRGTGRGGKAAAAAEEGQTHLLRAPQLHHVAIGEQPHAQRRAAVRPADGGQPHAQQPLEPSVLVGGLAVAARRRAALASTRGSDACGGGEGGLLLPAGLGVRERLIELGVLRRRRRGHARGGEPRTRLQELRVGRRLCGAPELASPQELRERIGVERRAGGAAPGRARPPLLWQQRRAQLHPQPRREPAATDARRRGRSAAAAAVGGPLAQSAVAAEYRPELLPQEVLEERRHLLVIVKRHPIEENLRERRDANEESAKAE